MNYTDILIGYGDATHNTCEGDSGGPAFLMRNGKEVIAGVTSFGDQNCQVGGADTRVDAYWDSFIKPHIQAVDGNVTTADMASSSAVSDAGTSITPPANGTVAVGYDCTDSAQCASGGICTLGTHRYCTVTCATNSSVCTAGTHCGSIGGAAYCVLNEGGCSTTPGSSSSSGALPAGFVLLLASFGLLLRRRALARGRI
jgi:hypothetical protein